VTVKETDAVLGTAVYVFRAADVAEVECVAEAGTTRIVGITLYKGSPLRRTRLLTNLALFFISKT